MRVERTRTRAQGNFTDSEPEIGSTGAQTLRAFRRVRNTFLIRVVIRHTFQGAGTHKQTTTGRIYI